jgi:adenine deaminase
MTLRQSSLVVLALLVVVGWWQSHPFTQAPAFDVVIRGGHVVDGTGNPWFAADVGIRGDTISSIDTRLDAAGARVVDGSGQVVAPGFIDVHSHSEQGREGQDMVGNPAAENNVRQGVTTVFASPKYPETRSTPRQGHIGISVECSA